MAPSSQDSFPSSVYPTYPISTNPIQTPSSILDPSSPYSFSCPPLPTTTWSTPTSRYFHHPNNMNHSTTPFPNESFWIPTVLSHPDQQQQQQHHHPSSPPYSHVFLPPTPGLPHGHLVPTSNRSYSDHQFISGYNNSTSISSTTSNSNNTTIHSSFHHSYATPFGFNHSVSPIQQVPSPISPQLLSLASPPPDIRQSHQQPTTTTTATTTTNLVTTSTCTRAPSYEAMITTCIDELESLNSKNNNINSNGKPFMGVTPKEIMTIMASKFAHVLPVKFQDSASVSLKRAARKGLVLRRHGLYTINPDYKGIVAKGRRKVNKRMSLSTLNPSTKSNTNNMVDITKERKSSNVNNNNNITLSTKCSTSSTGLTLYSLPVSMTQSSHWNELALVNPMENPQCIPSTINPSSSSCTSPWTCMSLY